MKNVKHTPGPWITEFSEAYAVRAQGDGGRIAIMANLKGQFGLAGRRDGGEVAANTRLIAAAPDLLDLAERIVEQGLSTSILKEFRAAIAKATGSAS